MQKLAIKILILMMFSPVTFAKAIIDRDVLTHVSTLPMRASTEFISVLVFIKSDAETASFLHDVQKIPGVKAEALHFMPAVALIMPRTIEVLNKIASYPGTAQISSNKSGVEELEVSTQALLLASSSTYPNVDNWWQHGYTGKSGVLGLIDSGIAVEHPALTNKDIIIRKEPGSMYSHYKNGVRSAHGTGATCIYASNGSGIFSRDLGVAHGATKIVAGFAGEGDGDGGPQQDLLLTYSTLDWMLNRAEFKPTIINYSLGNGPVTCENCVDWSGLAKVVDYVVNHKKILWVKSAGNQGWVDVQEKAPFVSSMTVPADNYNAITVANINPTIIKNGVPFQTENRNLHSIRYTSSRGPTLIGRRKPDLSAPGNDTRTCAPNPDVYHFTYPKGMDYRDEFRLMGGTSSAAPHVGGAILLLQDAGIRHPIAEKALLINSADAWTDNNKQGPDDPVHPHQQAHYAVAGSAWNRTYGWGYLNMEQAFNEKDYLIEDHLTMQQTIKEYEATLPVGAKITLVHERRVGYNKNNSEWKLSQLSLEMYDAKTNQLITRDNSTIDTVHQIANCKRLPSEKQCSASEPVRAIIRVKLLSNKIEGSQLEPFALASSVRLYPRLSEIKSANG